MRKKRENDKSDNAVEGSEEYFDESEHVDGLAEEERSTGVARAGLDGRGPYRNKWSRSQGTGWGAWRVMTPSMRHVLERHYTFPSRSSA